MNNEWLSGSDDNSGQFWTILGTDNSEDTILNY